MWLIWIGLVLLVLHFAGIWFEVIERTFGLDRKKSFDEMDRAKRKRIQKALGGHAPQARKGRAPRR
jgi:hypothetical protein